jgi:DNA-binding transcriptional MerR regulator
MQDRTTIKSVKGPFRVKELANMAQVSPDAVRYYTKEKLLKPKRDRSNQYKLYGRDDLVRLLFIQRAKMLGYTVNEIKKILAASEKGESPCPMVRAILEKKVLKNKQLLEESLALQKRIEEAIKKWRHLPDGLPVGDSICHLIESVT